MCLLQLQLLHSKLVSVSSFGLTSAATLNCATHGLLPLILLPLMLLLPLLPQACIAGRRVGLLVHQRCHHWCHHNPWLAVLVWSLKSLASTTQRHRSSRKLLCQRLFWPWHLPRAAPLGQCAGEGGLREVLLWLGGTATRMLGEGECGPIAIAPLLPPFMRLLLLCLPLLWRPLLLLVLLWARLPWRLRRGIAAHGRLLCWACPSVACPHLAHTAVHIRRSEWVRRRLGGARPGSAGLLLLLLLHWVQGKPGRLPLAALLQPQRLAESETPGGLPCRLLQLTGGLARLCWMPLCPLPVWLLPQLVPSLRPWLSPQLLPWLLPPHVGGELARRVRSIAVAASRSSIALLMRGCLCFFKAQCSGTGTGIAGASPPTFLPGLLLLLVLARSKRTAAVWHSRVRV